MTNQLCSLLQRSGDKDGPMYGTSPHSLRTTAQCANFQQDHNYSIQVTPLRKVHEQYVALMRYIIGQNFGNFIEIKFIQVPVAIYY